LVWLLDVEDLRAVYYWELQGARQALADLLRKYGRDLPGHVRKAVQRVVNDLEAELAELERELTCILPERKLVAGGDSRDSTGGAAGTA